jgi:23S rRNA (pseudouridine1915-N3)-methyltransferase
VRVELLSVGKPKDRPSIELHDRYAERIRRLGLAYAATWVPEERAGARYTDDHVREREGRLLREALGPVGVVVALDRAGEGLTSEGLAARLERWATPCLTLVIGGPLGLHRSVLERADHRWALSPATLPHELVRVLAAEQLYRALTILRGIPYHR